MRDTWRVSGQDIDAISLRARCRIVLVAAVAATLALVGCGGAAKPRSTRTRSAPAESSNASAASTAARVHTPAGARPRPIAFVTAETENRLLVVDPLTGRVTRRIALPAGPEYVAAQAGVPLVAVSASAGSVTLLDWRSLRRIAVLRGFGTPHIPEISPDGKYAYVTDDARGELAVIRLGSASLVRKLAVGAQAHHLSFRPDEKQAWVALGQSARTIVILDTSSPADPRIIGRFDPGFRAHDLLFTPDGQRVWITSASSSDVGVFSATSHRLLLSVPGGAPPQHIVLAGTVAFITSGYGSRIEMVNAATGRVLERASAPYGSFELSAAGGVVATASLLRGTLAVYSDRLRPLRVVQLAPATEDVALAFR